MGREWRRGKALDTALLWARCKAGDAASRCALIERYAELAARVARRVPAPTSGHVDRDDLESAGVMGLIDAVDRFEPDRGVPFEAYAALRIRGTVLDELRAAAGCGRGRAIHGTVWNVSLDLLMETSGVDMASPDDMTARHDAEDMRGRVATALRCLTPRQRELLARYYGDALTLRESGERMGITEARACQLHGRAIAVLRRALSVRVSAAAA